MSRRRKSTPLCRFCFFKPEFSVPTPWAYARWKDSREIPNVFTPRRNFKAFVRNDLERPVFEKFVFLAQAKTWLQEQPEVGVALMSGSGSTIFVALKNAADSEKLTLRARAELDPAVWSYACGTLENAAGHKFKDTTKRALRLFSSAPLQFRSRVFAIQFRDETCADFCRANRFAFIRVGAIAETLPHPSLATICSTRRVAFRLPCGSKARCETFAEVNNIADAFGHAATHAPQPMHAAASIARSASCFGTGIEFASGADPVRAEMKPPAWMIRSSALRSTTKSLITGNVLARETARPRCVSPS